MISIIMFYNHLCRQVGFLVASLLTALKENAMLLKKANRWVATTVSRHKLSPSLGIC